MPLVHDNKHHVVLSVLYTRMFKIYKVAQILDAKIMEGSLVDVVWVCVIIVQDIADHMFYVSCGRRHHCDWLSCSQVLLEAILVCWMQQCKAAPLSSKHLSMGSFRYSKAFSNVYFFILVPS